MADYSLFEQGDLLNIPIECYNYNATRDGFPVKAHWHYYMEIMYVNSGDMTMRMDDKEYHITSGELILFYPESIHELKYYPNGDKNIDFYAIKFDVNQLKLTPDYAPKLRSIIKSAKKKNMTTVFPREFCDKYKIRETIVSSLNESRNREYGSNLIQMMELCKLMVDILRYWQSKGFSIDDEAYMSDGAYDIHTITEYIDEHLSEGLRVEQVAELCNMSYSCFAKKFKLIFGTSCKDYIEHMRIYKVEEFLRFTDFDLNYISQETGFSDCSHMIKCFRREKGVTPGHYRNNYGNK